MSKLASRATAACLMASVLVCGACSSAHRWKPSSTPIATEQTPRYTGPAVIPNSTPLRKYVTMTACAKTASGWSAGGTATSGSVKKTYSIVVFFVTEKGTVMSSATSKTTVAAHAHKQWTASAAFAAPATTRCVLRGVA